MIESLELTMFRQHKDLKLKFTEGLNVLRGANEKGKSTIFEGVRYAFFGARGLDEPLDQVVTYDHDPKELKVAMQFLYSGRRYVIRRSKSGASMESEGLLVSGQAEVTSYVEKLFKTNLKTALQVQFASQGQLKDVVTSGVSTIALIESLSGLDEIDTLISKIQTQLPSGNTSLLESQVASLQAVEPPVLDLAGFDADCEAARIAVECAKVNCEAVDSELDALDLDTASAQVTAEQVRLRDVENLKSTLKDLGCKQKPNPPPFTAEEAAAKSLAHQKAMEFGRAVAYFKSLTQVRFNYCSKEELDAACMYITNDVKQLEQSIARANIAIARAEAKLVGAGECSFCGLELGNVPKVIEANSALRADIHNLSQDLSKYQSALEITKAREMELRQESEQFRRCLEVLGHTQYIVKASMTGLTVFSLSSEAEAYADANPSVQAMREYNTRLAEEAGHAHGKLSVYAVELANFETSQEILGKAGQRLTQLEAAKRDVSEARNILLRGYELKASMALTQAALAEAQKKLDVATNARHLATQIHAAKLEAYNQSRSNLEAIQESLKEVRENNALLKRLREVRPLIGARLWSIVLSAISVMFSSIRGVPSAVSRGPDGFLVNGRAVAGLSGSTKDTLGLAVRWGLQRTFLPLVDFALVDEPASGCDDARESAMIGQLSTCGYGQVILVTHSDLADSFAANLINL